MANRGQRRLYEETLACSVRVYFTQSQMNELFSVIGTTGDASAYLRNLFLESLHSSSPNYNALINKPDNLDNEGDG